MSLQLYNLITSLGNLYNFVLAWCKRELILWLNKASKVLNQGNLLTGQIFVANMKF